MAAAPSGKPGWPLFAFWTASTDKKRKVLTHRQSNGPVLTVRILSLSIHALPRRPNAVARVRDTSRGLPVRTALSVHRSVFATRKGGRKPAGCEELASVYGEPRGYSSSPSPRCWADQCYLDSPMGGLSAAANRNRQHARNVMHMPSRFMTRPPCSTQPCAIKLLVTPPDAPGLGSCGARMTAGGSCARAVRSGQWSCCNLCAIKNRS